MTGMIEPPDTRPRRARLAERLLGILSIVVFVVLIAGIARWIGG